MSISRRELNGLWAIVLAGSAPAAETELPSRVYAFESLPVKTNPQTHAESRQVLHGTTHEGFPIDLHVTTMPPGQSPHPPHHHIHEEMMLIQKGQLAATISGKTTVAGPGSIIYVHSMEEHGLKSVGEEAAQYFVLAIGMQKT